MERASCGTCRNRSGKHPSQKCPASVEEGKLEGSKAAKETTDPRQMLEMLGGQTGDVQGYGEWVPVTVDFAVRCRGLEDQIDHLKWQYVRLALFPPADCPSVKEKWCTMAMR